MTDRRGYNQKEAAERNLITAFRISAYTRKAVCAWYGIHPLDLYTRNRARAVAIPRLFAIGTAVVAGGALHQVGQLWGFNHTTAYHAKRVVLDYIYTYDDELTAFLLGTIRGARAVVGKPWPMTDEELRDKRRTRNKNTDLDIF